MGSRGGVGPGVPLKGPLINEAKLCSFVVGAVSTPTEGENPVNAIPEIKTVPDSNDQAWLCRGPLAPPPPDPSIPRSLPLLSLAPSPTDVPSLDHSLVPVLASRTAPEDRAAL